MVNDKAEATIHPGNPYGYMVWCKHCGEVCSVLFRDVADLLAERHEDTTGHETDVVEVMHSA